VREPTSSTRGQRRSWGKRRLKREAVRDVERALELHEKGYSPETISAVTKMPHDLVETILRESAEEEGEGNR
jgi:hypothetical protein